MVSAISMIAKKKSSDRQQLLVSKLLPQSLFQ